ncbi:hypothetical protein BKA70DRAFT_1357160 [Coprinopsis sp. MPI-PUGE-AT-0042]|nr:hypothetical protein BKA70DRAFT_1357160 [Coprinopsis sp. MPI-PUGE-AT-0042]
MTFAAPMSAPRSHASSSRARWSPDDDSRSVTWQEIEPAVLLCAAYYQEDFLDEDFISSCLAYRKDIQNSASLLLQPTPSTEWEPHYLGSGSDTPSTPTTSTPSPEPYWHTEQLYVGPTLTGRLSWTFGPGEGPCTEIPTRAHQTMPNPYPFNTSSTPRSHLAPRAAKRRTRSTGAVKPTRQAACHLCKVKKTRCYRTQQAGVSPLTHHESACA